MKRPIESSCSDRFIPCRRTSLLDEGLFKPVEKKLLTDVLLPRTTTLFSYQSSIEKQRDSFSSPVERLTGIRSQNNFDFKPRPHYAFKLYKLLDAPGLHSDFYAHLLSFSKKDQIFITLKDDDHFKIVSCNPEKNYNTSFSEPIRVGINPCALNAFNDKDVISGWSDGSLRIHTLEPGQLTLKKSFKLQDTTFNCIQNINENVFWLGSKDGFLSGYDSRQPKLTFRFSTQNVLVGIAYNYQNLIAVGTNEGNVKIWDVRQPGPTYYSDALHNNAGIRALSFHPNSPYNLISGGGNSCRRIISRKINSNFNAPCQFETDGQITGIGFLENKNYFVASTGYTNTLHLMHISNNQLTSLTQINVSLNNPEGRIIYLTTYKNKVIFATDTPSHERLNLCDIEGFQTKKEKKPDLFKLEGPTIR